MRITDHKYLALLAVLGATSAAEAVLIDDFSTGSYNIVANAANPNREAVRLGLMLGFQRDALVQYTGGPLNVSAIVDSGAVQFFNTDSETSGNLTLQYDGIDLEIENGVLNNGTNLNANLSGQNAFVFDFDFVDAGLSSSMVVMTTVATSSGTFTASSNVGNGANVQLVQPFSMFGGANFSDVDRVEFKFVGTPATDFTLDSISTAGIPGPAALAPFVVGLVSLLRKRRS